MGGSTNLSELLSKLNPVLQDGEYVFVSVENGVVIDFSDALGTFKEKEGTTLILDKKKADELHLNYDYIASWISLTVHSSLEAVGLTAAISNALAVQNISCNVVAAYYHDHIFVHKKDTQLAIEVLRNLKEK